MYQKRDCHSVREASFTLLEIMDKQINSEIRVKYPSGIVDTLFLCLFGIAPSENGKWDAEYYLMPAE